MRQPVLRPGEGGSVSVDNPARDHVAGFGNGAQAKVQRFLAATRGDNFIRRQGATGLHRPARDLRS